MKTWPSTQLVEKKLMFLVSRGFSWVNSGERVWGSDSPVRDELSTLERQTWCSHSDLRLLTKTDKQSWSQIWDISINITRPLSTLQPLEEMIRRSAGILSPPLISTRSPWTTSSALIWNFSPSRITRACWKKESQLQSSSNIMMQKNNLFR